MTKPNDTTLLDSYNACSHLIPSCVVLTRLVNTIVYLVHLSCHYLNCLVAWSSSALVV